MFLVVGESIAFFFYLAFIRSDVNVRKIYNLIQYFAGILLYVVPWSLFKYFYRAKIPVPEEIPNISHLFEYFYRVPVILEYFYRKNLFYGNWNIAWFVLILVVAISIIKRKFFVENMIVLYAIVFGLAAYGSVYCLSKNSWPYLLDGTVQNRNFLTFMPLVVYFICISIFSKKDNILGPLK